MQIILPYITLSGTGGAKDKKVILLLLFSRLFIFSLLFLHEGGIFLSLGWGKVLGVPSAEKKNTRRYYFGFLI